MIVEYSIVSFPQFSSSTWNTQEADDYLLSHAVICGYNATVRTSIKDYIINDFEATPFPWENPEFINPGGGEGTGTGGGNTTGGGTESIEQKYREIPFLLTRLSGYYSNEEDAEIAIYYNSGDTAINLNNIKCEVWTYAPESGETGNYLQVQQRIIFPFSMQSFREKWTYDEQNKILKTNYFAQIAESCVLKLKVYAIDGTELGETGYFTRSKPIYSNPDSQILDNNLYEKTNNEIQIDLGENTGQSIKSIMNSTKDIAISLFTFWGIFPPWLTSMIMAGIAIVIVLRILDR